jgi:hypothetical protein
MKLAPTPIDLVTTATAALLEDRARGTFQLTGPRDVVYADVGRFVASRIGADAGLVEETGARAAGLPDGATPLNTTLDSSLLRERYGLQTPDAWDIVGSIITATTSGLPASLKAQ